MRRLSSWRLALAGAVVIGVSVAPTILKVTPNSFDFGQVVVNGNADQMFQVDFTNPGFTDSLSTVILGPDAADFSVNTGQIPSPKPGSPTLFSTCLLKLPSMPAGSCMYNVQFHPTSIGHKSAQIAIADLGLKVLRATLKGEGIFGCSAYVVPCNYAGNYSGTIEVTTSNITVPPTGNVGSYVHAIEQTRIGITVTHGVAICDVSVNDSSTSYHGVRQEKISTESGVVSGPGILAVEFPAKSGGPQTYKLTAYCPRPDTKTYIRDVETGDVGTGVNPGGPADVGNDPILIEGTVTALGAALTGLLPNVVEYQDVTNGLTSRASYKWSLKTP